MVYYQGGGVVGDTDARAGYWDAVSSAAFPSALAFFAFGAAFAATGVFPSFNANCPRSTLANRDSVPFTLISRLIAANNVACGV